MSPNTLALSPSFSSPLTGVLIMLAEPVPPPAASRKPLGWLAILGTLAAGAATFYQHGHLVPGTSPTPFGHPRDLRLLRLLSPRHRRHRPRHPLTSLDTSAPTTSPARPKTSRPPITGAYGLPSSPSFNAPTPPSGHAGEYFALTLFAATGMMLMTSATELLMVFVGLEISSIATYIMAGYRKGNAASAESSLKYFLLGSFATAFFLYGVALAFGATGSTQIAYSLPPASPTRYPPHGLPRPRHDPHRPRLQGLRRPLPHLDPRRLPGRAPLPVVGFMSTAPKAAAFAVLLRILLRRLRSPAAPLGCLSSGSSPSFP